MDAVHHLRGGPAGRGDRPHSGPLLPLTHRHGRRARLVGVGAICLHCCAASLGASAPATSPHAHDQHTGMCVLAGCCRPSWPRSARAHRLRWWRRCRLASSLVRLAPKQHAGLSHSIAMQLPCKGSQALPADAEQVRCCCCGEIAMQRCGGLRRVLRPCCSALPPPNCSLQPCWPC